MAELEERLTTEEEGEWLEYHRWKAEEQEKSMKEASSKARSKRR